MVEECSLFMESLNRYQSFAVKLMNPNLTANERLANCALGLADEMCELAEAMFTTNGEAIRTRFTNQEKLNLLKELGDLAWYGAVLAHDFGYQLTDVVYPEFIYDVKSSAYTTARDKYIALQISLTGIMTSVKHIAFHAHPKDSNHAIKVADGIGMLFESLPHFATILDCDTGLTSNHDAIALLNKILQMNEEKLTNRYGDKFTTEASIHRKE